MKYFLLLFFSLMLAACGGSSSSDPGDSGDPGGSEAPPEDNGGPQEPNDPDNPPSDGEPAMETLSGAKFRSEDDVALLLVGSLRHQVLGETLLGTSFAQGFYDTSFLTFSEIAQMDFEQSNCAEGGDENFVGTQIIDPASPFTGAQFEVSEYHLDNCADGFGDMTLYSDGIRRLGYPISGDGSGPANEAEVLIAYDEWGSIERPMIQSIRTRVWVGHAQLELGELEGNRFFGAETGATHLFKIDRSSGLGENIEYIVQIGASPEEPLVLSYELTDITHNDNAVFSDTYEGYAGFSVYHDGEPLDTCPGGLFHVATEALLTVNDTDEDDGLESVFSQVRGVQGTVTMVDSEGVEALIEYGSGFDSSTVEISIAGAQPVAYDFDEIDAMIMQNCLGFEP